LFEKRQPMKMYQLFWGPWLWGPQGAFRTIQSGFLYIVPLP